ncbi:MAG: hypothetical protein V9F00_10925 [Nocardioides sp.]|jgi:hypothetical protein
MSQAAGSEPAAEVEQIPSRGDIAGPVLAAICAAVFLVAVLADGIQDTDLPVLAAIPVLGVMTWVLYRRPRLAVRGDVLHLRGAFEDIWLPLAAIERLEIRRVFVAHTGAGRYISTAQSRPLRQVMFPGQRAGDTKPSEISAADFLEQRLTQLAADARERAGVAMMSEEQLALAQSVVKRRAWPVIALALGTLALFALSILYVVG